MLVLAVALALAVVPLAAAGNGGGGGGGGRDKGKGKLKFELVGTVSAVVAVSDETTPTVLMVEVKACNKPLKAFRGQMLEFDAPGARVRIVIAKGCIKGTLADVPVGTRVKARGRVDRTDPANPMYVALDIKAQPASEPTP